MPKGMDNSALIIDAARAAFLDRGYGATTMDVVAQEAGVSKATVYALFRSKDQLFAAVIEQQGHSRLVKLETSADSTTADLLRQFALDAAEMLLSPSNVAILRAVSSEAARAPAVGRLFYANGPDRLLRQLATFLEEAMRRGDLRKVSPRLAAAQFLAVIVGDLQLRLAMGLKRPTRDERDGVACAGVELFLRGYSTA
jgi:TetR/AcrR family transcriptional regulator, mexJK operon transcriptional repressor